MAERKKDETQQDQQTAQDQPQQDQQNQSQEPMKFTGTVTSLGNTTTIQFLQRQQLDEQLGDASQGSVQLLIADPAVLASLSPGQEIEVTLTPGSTAQQRQDQSLGGQVQQPTPQRLPRTPPNARRAPGGFAPQVASQGGRETVYPNPTRP